MLISPNEQLTSLTKTADSSSPELDNQIQSHLDSKLAKNSKKASKEVNVEDLISEILTKEEIAEVEKSVDDELATDAKYQALISEVQAIDSFSSEMDSHALAAQKIENTIDSFFDASSAFGETLSALTEAMGSHDEKLADAWGQKINSLQAKVDDIDSFYLDEELENPDDFSTVDEKLDAVIAKYAAKAKKEDAIKEKQALEKAKAEKLKAIAIAKAKKEKQLTRAKKVFFKDLKALLKARNLGDLNELGWIGGRGIHHLLRNREGKSLSELFGRKKEQAIRTLVVANMDVLFKIRNDAVDNEGLLSDKAFDKLDHILDVAEAVEKGETKFVYEDEEGEEITVTNIAVELEESLIIFQKLIS